MSAKKGIDLSSWQSELTRGELLTAAGIEFAVLKLSEGRTLRDRAFSAHYDMCRSVNIPVGAYVYSHATDADGGRAEAEFALKTLGGRALALPIFLDIEGGILSAGRSALMASALAFADTVRAAGYRAGVYASLYPFTVTLDADALRKKDISIWCAAYNSTGAGMDCDFWQYTNKGRIAGYNGDIDMNYCYTDFLDKQYSGLLTDDEDPVQERLYHADMSGLCRGFYGSQVAVLQKLLGVTADGVFGAETENAVHDFQRKNGLAADGIAGTKTFEKLLK